MSLLTPLSELERVRSIQNDGMFGALAVSASRALTHLGNAFTVFTIGHEELNPAANSVIFNAKRPLSGTPVLTSAALDGAHFAEVSLESPDASVDILRNIAVGGKVVLNLTKEEAVDLLLLGNSNVFNYACHSLDKQFEMLKPSLKLLENISFNKASALLATVREFGDCAGDDF